MKENSIEVMLLLIVTIACVLVVLIQLDVNIMEKGSSYSNYNVITYDDKETLMHEVCHVMIEEDKQDYFDDNNMQELCSQGCEQRCRCENE